MFKKIVFRADGNSSIGLGHVFRCISLLEMLKNDFDCVFATNSDDEIKQIISLKADNVITLPNNDTHFDVFLKMLKGDEIVVLDNYYFNSNYQKNIKNKGCKLVCIDDIPEKHFFADIVINHSFGVTTSDYSKEDYTKCLLGLNYALLSNDFIETPIPDRISSNNNIKAFVCFGGADPLNLTFEAASQLSKSDIVSSVDVVVGEAFDKSKINQISTLAKVSLHRSIPRKAMAEIMSLADFAVVPSSGILIEALSMHLPVITGYYIDNQRNIFTSMADKKIGLIIGDIRKLQISNETIVSLMNMDYEVLIDQESPRRILEEFKMLANES